jgi:hypothetical protein
MWNYLFAQIFLNQSKKYKILMKKIEIKKMICVLIILIIIPTLIIILIKYSICSFKSDVQFFKSFYEKIDKSEKNLLIILGTRPEIIKMSPIIKELKIQKINFILCLTGQHTDLIVSLIEFFDLQIDCNLNLFNYYSPNQSHFISNGLIQIEKLFSKIKFEMVMVHGKYLLINR